MADQCPLCERRKEPNSEFCDIHTPALTNLENAYSAWNKAYAGNLTRKEYYVKLESLTETGRAVKDVIQHLRGKGAVE